MDAVEPLRQSSDGRLPSNGRAVFNYTKNGSETSLEFPVPLVKPTILSVEKELFDLEGNLVDLEDDTMQREYHYRINDGGTVLVDDYNDHVKLLNYHILQSVNELQIEEYKIVHDDMNRYTAGFRFNEDVLQPDRFTIAPESGFNHLEIANRLVSDYNYNDLSIDKTVMDANENMLAEWDEVLTYTIDITNTDNVFVR